MIEVDVIIPFHNPVDRFLIAAINSVRDSKGVKAEPLLINNNLEKNDSTLFLKKLGLRVIDQPVKGYSAALNIGYQNSSSEYIAILNSDDLQTPDRIVNQITRMKAEETSVSICRLKKFSNHRKHFEISGRQPKRYFDKSLLLLGAYGANASLIVSNCFSKKAEFENVDMADWKFAIDHYPKYISFIDEPNYFYRMHRRQITRKKIEIPEWFDLTWKSHFGKISPLFVHGNVIHALAMPNRFTKLNTVEFENMIETIFIFLKYFSELNKIDYSSAVKILKRRMIFSLIKSDNRALIFSDRLPFSVEKLAIEGIEIFFEGILNLDVARR